MKCCIACLCCYQVVVDVDNKNEIDGRVGDEGYILNGEALGIGALDRLTDKERIKSFVMNWDEDLVLKRF